MFDWDQHNLRKIKAHGVTAPEAEQAISIRPILIYEQDADGESRYVYYGETEGLRLLAVIFDGTKWKDSRDHGVRAGRRPEARLP